MPVPSDGDILAALINLAPSTRCHYQKCYRDYLAGDHRPAKKYIYDLVMRKVHYRSRLPVPAAPAAPSHGHAGPIILQAPVTSQLIGVIGLMTITALAFVTGAVVQFQNGC